MTNAYRIACAAALLLAAAAVPASAQRIDSPYRFLDPSQQVGIFYADVDASDGPAGLGPRPGSMLGARWAIRISGPFSAGAEVGYLSTTRLMRDTTFSAADSAFNVVGEADMGLLTVNGVLTFSLTGPRTWHGLRPLVSLGAGAAFDLAGRPEAEAELPTNVRYRFGTSFAGHFGGGVEWFPTERVSLRGDVRNSLWRSNVPEGFLLTDAGRGLPRSRWESNLTLMAGLSFHF